MYRSDTIAAIATCPGSAGIGIVRVSGPQALAICEQVFSPSRASSAARSHHLRHGLVCDESGEPIDEALATIMYAPHSYTGEDVLELHCHGSPLALRRTLERCIRCGARAAEPGEFTKRAFLNGKLDLIQAEAVGELISAQSAAAQRAGMRHLSGSLSVELAALRDALIEVKARAEVMIDFTDEDIDVTPAELVREVDAVADKIDVLLASFRTGTLLREGIHIALLGRPNVGKSSLLNALLGRDRAIVAPLPGTTRDVITETLDIHGIPAVIADTAGVRLKADDIEQLGIERTRREAATADLVIVVLDGSEALTSDDYSVLTEIGGAPKLIVINKTDLPPRWTPADVLELSNVPTVLISAITGEGLGVLRRSVFELVGASALNPNDAILTIPRHRDALRRAREALRIVQRSLASDHPIDLVAVDIQAAVEHIGTITGEVTSEEVLDRIFRDFCIGK